ncbi:hypothetical protein BGZ58_000839 [Dissophora ornata]|nr:hypothetical protein BGZ58_000839 [Dissophora ornata]
MNKAMLQLQPSMSAAINPLDLPEIRDIIATFLRKRDLAQCTRVCRAWHASFLPVLWSSLDFDSLTKPSCVDPKILEHHCHFVKCLAYSRWIFRHGTGVTFPNLQTLHITNINFHLTTLIAQHPQITRLTLEAAIHQSIRRPFWKTAVVSLQSLTDLYLFGGKIDKSECPDFWKLCSRLESLKLINTLILQEPSDTSLIFANMKNLKMSLVIGLSHDCQLDILVRMPRLTQLNWISLAFSGNDAAMDQFVQLVVKGAWPELQGLQFGISMVSEVALATILNSTPRITMLSVPKVAFSTLPQSALQRHFPWLKTLEFSTLTTSTSGFVAEILASCPQLESLMTNSVMRVMAQDIIDGRVWACQNSLRVLRLFFLMSDEPTMAARQQEGILARLSECKRLRSLDVGKSDGLYTEHSLDFRLEKGLGQLAKLSMLEDIAFAGTVQRMNREEVEWMIQSWKGLASVKGMLNEDRSEMMDLQMMFHVVGITTS